MICDGKTLEMRHLANEEELKQFVNLAKEGEKHFFNTKADVLHKWTIFSDAFIGFFKEDGDLIGRYLLLNLHNAKIFWRPKDFLNLKSS